MNQPEDKPERTLIDHIEACRRLALSRDTVRAMMADTPPDADRPWVNVGSPRRPVYRWRPGPDDEALWRWAREVEQWRAGARRVAVAAPSRKARGKGRTAAEIRKSRALDEDHEPRTPAEIRRARAQDPEERGT